MKASFAVTSPTNQQDNSYVTDKTNFLYSNAFSRWVFNTSATHLLLKTWNTIFDNYPNMAQIGIVINGSYFTTLQENNLGLSVFNLDLPAGAKTIEIVTGGQSINGDPTGSFLKSVYFSGAADTLQTPVATPADRMVIYGDSITETLTYPARDSWPVLMRQWIPTVAESYGARYLKIDCLDAAARTNFAAHIATMAPSRVWLAIGRNDWGISSIWSAANFGAAYADLLDKLHTALPSAIIYAQTPIVQASEIANGFGNTLGDYRAQIATAQSTRAAFCTLVDGTQILTTDDLADGVHPKNSGHVKYAAFARTAIGL